MLLRTENNQLSVLTENMSKKCYLLAWPFPSYKILFNSSFPSLVHLGFIFLTCISPVEFQQAQSANKRKSCERQRLKAAAFCI